MIERDLEAKCVKIVRTKHRGKAKKLDTGPDAKGWLDRAFWLPGNIHFIVEFKMPGCKPTEKQQEMLDWFKANYFPVFLVQTMDDWDEKVEPWIKCMNNMPRTVYIPEKVRHPTNASVNG